ncbi:MAG TPA: S1/P1 nuclease [Steroidobacteraceae bacterium]|nr:S1/P1 nuclease [Steroidobacteraceae bacterium]
MRTPSPGWRATLYAVLILLLPARALAWSETGHWLVGKLAETQLTMQARAEVRRLLAGEQDPTLGGVAAWADALRQSDPARFRATSRWHYINARNAGCGFDLARDCADGQCIVAAIEEQRRLLADPGQKLERRRDALKFIVHLVGDIHQPLHASDRNDSGGNRFQVQLTTAPSTAGRTRGGTRATAVGTNLHSVWDYHVLASAGQGRDGLAARLREALPAPPVGSSAARPSVNAPLEWALESCALLDAQAIYPAEHVLDHRYLDAHRSLAEQRIVQAATRLAVLLNATLAAPR